MQTNRSALPIEVSISGRYSPRSFMDEPLTKEQIGLLFEAARWGASSMNEQPWRFLLTHRGTTAFDRLAGALNASNAVWASKGAVLVLTMARRQFMRNDKPNVHAWHDVGFAVGNLAVQATAMGLGVHQMGGFDADKARTAFQVPELFDLVTVLVIGRPGPPEALPDALRERELQRSPRKGLNEILFEERAPIM